MSREKFGYYALKLTGICIIVFVLQMLFSNFTSLFVLNARAFPEVWRFITAIFLHGSLVHLLYNMFALALFGSILEKIIGSRKFLIVFFVSGIFANIIGVNFYSSSLGASGAIFGVLGALVIIRPMMVVWAFGMPMPMFIAGILWVVGDLIGIFVPSDVANIAHLAGMALGLVFGILFRDWGEKRAEQQKIVLNEKAMRQWEDNYLE